MKKRFQSFVLFSFLSAGFVCADNNPGHGDASLAPENWALGISNQDASKNIKGIPRSVRCPNGVCLGTEIIRSLSMAGMRFETAQSLPKTTQEAGAILQGVFLSNNPTVKKGVPGVSSFAELGQKEVNGKPNPYYDSFWYWVHKKQKDTGEGRKIKKVEFKSPTSTVEQASTHLAEQIELAKKGKARFPILGTRNVKKVGGKWVRTGSSHAVLLSGVEKQGNGDIVYSIMDSASDGPDKKANRRFKYIKNPKPGEAQYLWQSRNGSWGPNIGDDVYIGEPLYFDFSK